ncbi:M56 family metallopeptidase [Calderihabitans maritimus]|uniref:Peptidase M56 BlaR1 n=1 Tax=Calderihabitans maritimus TaxID=1246530 RepID=A0A1Z5HW36_9FIRM|nr:M56 family metallopeptidase [Calderihabitans maritimus]GAW93753.1 peptidase M56 BlaR1 [Calderihabitans maritimus]
MTAVNSFLHTFSIYVILGTLLSFILAQFSIRILGLREVSSKIRLMYLTLTIPFLAYLVIQVLFPRVGIYQVYQASTSELRYLFAVMCQIGYWVSLIITPFAMLVVALIAAKITLGIWTGKQLITRFGYASDKKYPEVFAVLQQLADKLRIAPPRVVVASGLGYDAFTIGWLRPVIVLSRQLIESIDTDELEAVLAHELAHVRRRDNLTNWIAGVLRDLMFFTPVAFWSYAILRDEKEKAADDLAVNITGKPLVYGATLIKIWKKARESGFDKMKGWGFYAVASSYLGSKNLLAARIHRVLERPQVPSSNCFMSVYLLIIFSVGFFLSFVC